MREIMQISEFTTARPPKEEPVENTEQEQESEE